MKCIETTDWQCDCGNIQKVLLQKKKHRKNSSFVKLNLDYLLLLFIIHNLDHIIQIVHPCFVSLFRFWSRGRCCCFLLFLPQAFVFVFEQGGKQGFEQRRDLSCFLNWKLQITLNYKLQMPTKRIKMVKKVNANKNGGKKWKFEQGGKQGFQQSRDLSSVIEPKLYNSWQNSAVFLTKNINFFCLQFSENKLVGRRQFKKIWGWWWGQGICWGFLKIKHGGKLKKDGTKYKKTN